MGPASREDIYSCMNVAFLLLLLPCPVPHGIAGAYAEIYALTRSVLVGAVRRWLCQQQSFILGRNCVLALVLFTATHFFPLPPSLTPPPDPPPPSHDAQKGYDIILEWALRYIALFPQHYCLQKIFILMTEVPHLCTTNID